MFTSFVLARAVTGSWARTVRESSTLSTMHGLLSCQDAAWNLMAIDCMGDKGWSLLGQTSRSSFSQVPPGTEEPLLQFDSLRTASSLVQLPLKVKCRTSGRFLRVRQRP